MSQQRRFGASWQPQNGSASSLRQPLLTQSRTAEGGLHGSPMSHRHSAASTPGHRRSSKKLPRAKSDFVGSFGMQETSPKTDDHIRVVVRVRPRGQHEEPAILEVQQDQRTIRFLEKGKLLSLSFDRVLGEAATQQHIFEASAVPLVEHALEGFNCSLCAYGQTGAGKTYTSFGPFEAKGVRGCPDARGLVQRSLEQLFLAREEASKSEAAGSHRWSMQCSFLEIYREQISDLLDARGTNLSLREDSQRGVFVEDLAQVEVPSLESAFQVVRRGLQQRRVASTQMNDRSSRSHAIFTVNIQRQTDAGTRSSSFSFVDLAGAERQSSTSTADLGEEMMRVKEAGAINKSLSALTDVVLSLSEGPQGSKHIRYRDSKLTFLLRDSLGGNAKSAIVANVAPSQVCQAETASTLRFASRAKSINCQAVRSEELPTSHDGLVREVLSLRRRLWELTASRTESLAQNLAAAFNTPPSWGRSRSISSDQAERVEEDDDGQGSSTGSFIGKLFQHAKNVLQPEEEPGAAVAKQISSKSAAETAVSATSGPHSAMAGSSTAETGFFSRRASEVSDHAKNLQGQSQMGGTTTTEPCASTEGEDEDEDEREDEEEGEQEGKMQAEAAAAAAAAKGRSEEQQLTGAAKAVSEATTQRKSPTYLLSSSEPLLNESPIAAPEKLNFVAVESQEKSFSEQQHRKTLDSIGAIEEQVPMLPSGPLSGNWIAIGEGQSPREIPTSEALRNSVPTRPRRHRWLLAAFAVAGTIATLFAFCAAELPTASVKITSGSSSSSSSSSSAATTADTTSSGTAAATEKAIPSHHRDSHSLRGTTPPPGATSKQHSSPGGVEAKSENGHRKNKDETQDHDPDPKSKLTKHQQEDAASAEAGSKKKNMLPSSTPKAENEKDGHPTSAGKNEDQNPHTSTAQEHDGHRIGSSFKPPQLPEKHQQQRQSADKHHPKEDEKEADKPAGQTQTSTKTRHEDDKKTEAQKSPPHREKQQDAKSEPHDPKPGASGRHDEASSQQAKGEGANKKHNEEKKATTAEASKKDEELNDSSVKGESAPAPATGSSDKIASKNSEKHEVTSSSTSGSQSEPKKSTEASSGHDHKVIDSTSKTAATNTNSHSNTDSHSNHPGASHGSGSAHSSGSASTGQEHASAPHQHSLPPQGVGVGAGISSGTSASSGSNSGSSSSSSGHGHGGGGQAHPAEHQQAGTHASHGSSSLGSDSPATETKLQANTQTEHKSKGVDDKSSASHKTLTEAKQETTAAATTKAATTTAAPTPAFVCKHHRCDSGGCDQRGCSRPLCDGGHCNQEGTLEPDCAAGHCNQKGAVGAVCGGGGCTH